MGGCCCKEKAPDESVYLAAHPASTVVVDSHLNMSITIDPDVVDDLIREMLTVAASRVDFEEETPISLVKLHLIAEIDEGWIQMIISAVSVVPLEDPYGPTAISILLDDCPLPSRDAVTKVTIDKYFLSPERTRVVDLDVRVERNLCLILGCIAEKLAGPNSVSLLTENILGYLLAYLSTEHESCIVLHALIAIQKFAHTTENKVIIKSLFEQYEEHPLLVLEKFANSSDCLWRQVGFSAKWALDNIFVIEGRPLSYEVVDMSGINTMLNCHNAGEYLQISANGLEARCDSYSFESVRCTYQIDSGCWYYEATVISAGIMQIGWATKLSYFSNDDGYGTGDDANSIAYDGCRKQLWYNARPTHMSHMPAWNPGDVLGCLIDLNAREVIFSVNEYRMEARREIFDTARSGFFAAASFMAYQQCRFNFGYEAFRYPPADRQFYTFNDYGHLTDEQKKVIPKRIYLELLMSLTVRENSCNICFDSAGFCILEPCGHRGFCPVCTSRFRECPMCRADILNVKRDGA